MNNGQDIQLHIHIQIVLLIIVKFIFIFMTLVRHIIRLSKISIGISILLS